MQPDDSRKLRFDCSLVGQEAAMIVAHPDDEILWAGSLLIQSPLHWFVMTVCRQSDRDRASKFRKVMQQLGADGGMTDLDDGPEQEPLDIADVATAILNTVPSSRFDLIVTHGPNGEYTRHRRHEEVCRAVVSLWRMGHLRTNSLWMFAYNDGGGTCTPTADDSAHKRMVLSKDVWWEKYKLITSVYGFSPESWEARVCPKEESFWCFETADQADTWIKENEIKNESTHAL